MDDKHIAYREIRSTLMERLRRVQIAPGLLDDLSIFKLIGLLHLMTGHVGYMPTYVNVCWTTETILGKDLFYDSPSELKAAAEKPEPVKEAVH